MDIPIKTKKELPYNEKKVITLHVIKNTNPASFIVFFVFKL